MAEDHLENGKEVEKEPENTETKEKMEKEEEVKEEAKEEVKETAEKIDEKVEEKTENEDKKEEKQEVTPELLKRIKDQIEYYFGNVNMQRDKFLNEQVKLDEGWVPLSVMLNFNLLGSLSKDMEVILKALEGSELIEISEDKKKIRRTPSNPLPTYDEEYKKAQEERSVYVKGFPQENTTINMLKEFFAPYEPIEHIFMRRYKDKSDKNCFKGSIFVQFATIDAAKSFMDIESIKYEETELIRKWSKDYTVEKAKEREEVRAKREKKKGGKDATKQEKEKENEKKQHNFPKGSIIHITGLSSEISREDIKEEISKIEGNVAYIEYMKGNTEAWVRLQDEDTAKTVVEKMENGKLTINGVEITCRVLEGEEEDTYLQKVGEDIKNLRHRNNKGRGRRGNAGKRRHSPSRDDSQKKKSRY